VGSVSCESKFTAVDPRPVRRWRTVGETRDIFCKGLLAMKKMIGLLSLAAISIGCEQPAPPPAAPASPASAHSVPAHDPAMMAPVTTPEPKPAEAAPADPGADPAAAPAADPAAAPAEPAAAPAEPAAPAEAAKPE
jgi:predicted lipid-binding transport protein (Tim44 family)